MNIRWIMRRPGQAQTPDYSAPSGHLGFGVGLIFHLPPNGLRPPTRALSRHAWEIYSAPCFGITELPQIRVQNKRSHLTIPGYFSAPSII